MSRVSIVRGGDIRARTEEAIRRVGGIGSVVKRGDKVFVKPNLVDGAPFITGEVTQLETIEVLIKESFDAGASEVIVGETPTYRRPTETIEKYRWLAEDTGAKFLELNNYPFVEVEVKNPRFFSTVRLSKPLLESDVFINVPTLKTHAQYGITVAIKNMYGLIPPEDRMFYHYTGRVEEAIIDLCKVKRADLIVVDGTYTTLHLGPRPIEDFRETHRLDLTIAGFDPVAIDAISARILGVEPSTIRYLRWAEEDGLGISNLSSVEVTGISLEEARFGKAIGIAEYVNSRMNDFKIANFGACTGCLQLMMNLVHFLRFSGLSKRSLKPSKIICVVGPKARADEIKGMLDEGCVILLCGYCAAPTFYNGLRGHFVPGCPPSPEELQLKIKEIYGF